MSDDLKSLSNIWESRRRSYELFYDTVDRLIDYYDKINKDIGFEMCDGNGFSSQIDVVSRSWKDSYVSIVKFGKTVDRCGGSNFSSIVDIFKTHLSYKEEINHSLVYHFYKSGYVNIVDVFLEESGTNIDYGVKKRFYHFSNLLYGIRNKNSSLLFQWLGENNLSNKDNKNILLLEFSIHRMYYVNLLISHRGIEAMEYAVKNFSPFIEHYKDEVNMLMGCLPYVKQIETSPYINILNKTCSWSVIEKTITKEYNRWMGIPEESPLDICTKVGSCALFQLLKICDILLKDIQIQDKSDSIDGEIPMEVSIPSDFRFHSVFFCPVLKTLSCDKNPPMLMLCGHVISQEAINGLLANTEMFKCPYCPCTMCAADVIRLYI